jgi:hypothetical protein
LIVRCCSLRQGNKRISVLIFSSSYFAMLHHSILFSIPTRAPFSSSLSWSGALFWCWWYQAFLYQLWQEWKIKGRLLLNFHAHPLYSFLSHQPQMLINYCGSTLAGNCRGCLLKKVWCSSCR